MIACRTSSRDMIAGPIRRAHYLIDDRPQRRCNPRTAHQPGRSAVMKARMFVLASIALLASAASANAQQDVKIGVLYPLSGPTAQIGLDAVAAVRTAVDIV